MAKNGVFKKITALAMAIALVVCFAVSASAVTVSTTTKYVGEVDSVKYIDVTVNVTDAGANNNVTYYATKQVSGNTVDVHIDQEKADGNGSAEFNYRTEYANLGTTTAKIGVTDASSAETEGGEVDGYKVTLVRDGINLDVKNVADEDDLTVVFAYEASDNKTFDEVEVSGNATNVTATPSEENDTLTVTFTEITGDVTLTVIEKDAVTTKATAEVLEIGAKISTGRVDGVIGDVTDAEDNVIENADVQASKGDIKLTVVGKATGAREYGIIVTTADITADKMDADAFENAYGEYTYKGITILEDDETFEKDGKDITYKKGLFAVQIINTEVAAGEEAMLVKGTQYNVAVYAKDEVTDEYVISSSETITIPADEAEQN